MKKLQQRRDFLKMSAAGALGIAALGPAACKSVAETGSSKPGVGIQLYTVRDAMGSDVAGTLQKVADIGYQNLELASYANGKFYGFAPGEFKKMVNDMGMQIVSSHAGVEATGITKENAQKMADDHAELGVEYVVQPWVNDEDRNIETYKRMINDWNEVGKIMKDVGIQFGYHNHNFEFKPMDGIIPYYDIFMPEMDEDLITMELDLYWATKAGQDPVEMFKKYPGRFQLLHFKDMADDNNIPFYDVVKEDLTSVGSGLIDFERIWEARETAGMEYFFVEDDNQGSGTPFQAIKTSYNNLTNNIMA